MRKTKQFLTNEEFKKIYSDALEGAPQASEDVRNSYNKMKRYFEEYLVAIEEQEFRYAYQLGYEAAMAEMKKGGAA